MAIEIVNRKSPFSADHLTSEDWAPAIETGDAWSEILVLQELTIPQSHHKCVVQKHGRLIIAFLTCPNIISCIISCFLCGYLVSWQDNYPVVRLKQPRIPASSTLATMKTNPASTSSTYLSLFHQALSVDTIFHRLTNTLQISQIPETMELID